ncbi:tetratricopeptide repeat protein [Trichloromonas sp.]|uniref:tetratricopeptide repeat protein n=1 Tax=Trichloromonas sp. TaxID=3069249 RepID=UPI002A3D8EDC|nr:tetratricopeptide repeat protein [Trichloromonas sp.]
MGLLSRFFSPKNPLENLRRLARDERWADLLRLGEAPDEDLALEIRDEWHALLTLAGDRLAELNLAEGEACLNIGDRERALEHFQLAAEHGRSEVLREDARRRLTELSLPSPSRPPSSETSACCPSGCAASLGKAPGEAEAPDLETRLELVLSNYPPELAELYRQVGTAFRRAFLAAHDGRDGEALAGFDALPAEEQDASFHFERGALLARMGDVAAGRWNLEKAVALNPAHVLALETLVRLDFLEKRPQKAEERLTRMLAAQLVPAFCHGCLARLRAAEGDFSAALLHGEEALREGPVEMDVLLLLASLYEREGRFTEAENLLRRLPGSGCGGASHVLLAEFWLRRGESLKKALESFRAEARRDPGNPRWQLRMAQVCAALGWLKDGRPWLDRLPALDDLPSELRQEAGEVLALYGK